MQKLVLIGTFFIMTALGCAHSHKHHECSKDSCKMADHHCKECEKKSECDCEKDGKGH